MSIGPGDVVVCVDDAPRPDIRRAPTVKRGSHYRVLGVRFCAFEPPEHRIGLDVGSWHSAARFRKIEAADEQFTETVRACKPIKTREPA